MLTVGTYNLELYSLRQSRNVTLVKLKFETIRDSFLKVVWLVLYFPVSLLVGFLFYRSRKKLTKLMRNEKTYELNNSKDYVSFKKHVEEIEYFMPFITTVKDSNVDDLPLFYRYAGKQVKKLSTTLLQYNSWCRKVLEKYNNPLPQNSSNSFKFTSEKELWEKRNNAYEYWM